MKRDVTVVIPVYDRYSELERALKSVVEQSVGCREVIVVDDGSPGDIKAVVDSFSDNRFIYLRNEENRGVSYSRNRGIEAAGCPFIALLDSDDQWLPQKIERQLALFEQEPRLRMVHTEEIWMRNGKRVKQKKRHKKRGGELFIPSLELCIISPSSVMIKRELFAEVGLFDEELIVCEDYDLWLRITASDSLGFIEEPMLIKYGGHSDQLSFRYEAMDRFRLQSLLKLESTLSLDSDKKEALVAMIVKKATILLNGARKRESSEADFYEEVLSRFYNCNVS